MFDNLNNGGWAQVVDFAVDLFADDDTMEKATCIKQWIALLDEASLKFGKRLNIAHNHKQWMIEAGFKNVTEEVYKIPTNPWPKDPSMKEIGRYQQPNILESLPSHSWRLMTRVLGWSNEEVEAQFAGIRRQLVDRNVHTYSKFLLRIWSETGIVEVRCKIRQLLAVVSS